MFPKVNATAKPIVVLLTFLEHVLPRQHTIRHGLITSMVAEDESMILKGLVHDGKENTPDRSGV
jgi:hypothetical protein